MADKRRRSDATIGRRRHSAAEQRNWVELPVDLLALIFRKLGGFEVLCAAQAVCRPWRHLALDPQFWRCIDMRFHSERFKHIKDTNMEALARVAVDRSAGHVEEFYGEQFPSDELLAYIADRTTGMRCLVLVSADVISDEGLLEFIVRCPLLEELQLTDCFVSDYVCEDIGLARPELKRFRFNETPSSEYNSDFEPDDGTDYDMVAIDIANTMPQLRELQLIGNRVTNEGLHAILDKCLHLESLDIRACINVDVDAGLSTKLAKIKMVKLPHDYPEWRNWLELPGNVLALIFRKLGGVDVLWTAQAVCRLWRQLALEPRCWRCIDMRGRSELVNLGKLARVAVDRSGGHVEEFYADYFGDDDLLNYIAYRTTGLRCLGLISTYNVSDEGLVKFIGQCPLLEELQITNCNLSEETLRDIGRVRPELKRFRLNMRWYKLPFADPNLDLNLFDLEAIGIADNMAQLCELQLIGNHMTNMGLHAILDKCLHLESLDIRACLNIYVDGSLHPKLAKIKNVKLPHDSTAGYDFETGMEKR